MNLFQFELLIFVILMLIVIPVILLDRQQSLRAQDTTNFPFGLFYGTLISYSVAVSFHWVLLGFFKLGASFFSLFI